MELKDLPKVELHLHLDCSLSFEVVRHFDPSVTRPFYESHFKAPAKCVDLPDFLARAAQGIRMTQSEAQLYAVTIDLLGQLKKEHVIYAEIRFAPLEHVQQGLAPEKVVETVLAALDEGGRLTGIRAGLILCTLREYPADKSIASARLAVKYRDHGVSGFDMAGNEADFPIDDHIAGFRLARDHGIPCTSHAGEARGPESVRDTLRHFGTVRIGHGVRSIEDQELVEELAEKGVHLEICPSSNVQINVYDTLADHPVDRLRRAGVSLGINTDSRTLSNTTLEQEYGLLAGQFGWGPAEFLQCNMYALRAAFLPEAEKARLAEILTKGYGQTGKL